MRVNILTILIILFAGSSLYAQILIEDPIYGSALQTRSVLSTTGGITIPFDDTQVLASSTYMVVADSMQSSAVTDGYQLNYSTVHGVLEFDIQSISIPDSITSLNFTARLMGLTGALQNTSEDLKIDLYPLMKDQRNGYISKDDFNAITGSASKEGPFADVFFPTGGVDVTEQVKESLFGAAPDDYLGFIMIPNSGNGVAVFENLDLIKIKITPVTDSDPVDTETASDTSSQTDSDDTSAADDTDSTETDTETDTDIDTDIADPDVSCSCNTTVGYNPLSLLKLIF